MITGKVKTMYEDAEKTKAIFPRTHAKAVTDLIDTIYPVGSIYMNINYHHPADLFGGTWELISGRFLVGHGSNGVDLEVSAGDTGGEAKHTLTESEMPTHHHWQYGRVYGYSGWTPYTTQAYTVMINANSGGNYLGPDTSTYSTTLTMDTSTSDNGGSQPHNNLPPYLAVYIWKRTA